MFAKAQTLSMKTFKLILNSAITSYLASVSLKGKDLRPMPNLKAGLNGKTTLRLSVMLQSYTVKTVRLTSIKFTQSLVQLKKDVATTASVILNSKLLTSITNISSCKRRTIS